MHALGPHQHAPDPGVPRRVGATRYFYASSACVYAADKQTSTDVVPLVEADAYPAMPEDGYGWEKLFSERMCRHFAEDFGMETRVARFHNVYGPHGTYGGGREKAPAAICRKVAAAVLDGRRGHRDLGRRRADPLLHVRRRLHRRHPDDHDGPSAEPINLGSAELVSINQLVDIVEEIAGTRLARRHRLDAPQGVRGRSSDNTLIRETYGWEPSTALRVGLEETYEWIMRELQTDYQLIAV